MDFPVEQLARLRIAIARYGEMDRLKWWNTKGLLSHVGELAISRGFPKTHVFARARAAFAVASARSEEVFDPPDSYTLWRLPVEIEDQLEDAWAHWLENPDDWKEFVDGLDNTETKDLLSFLTELGLISDETVDRASRLRRADDSRSVPVKANGSSSQELVCILAAAHTCSEPGKLAVPYVRREEFPQ